MADPVVGDFPDPLGDSRHGLPELAGLDGRECVSLCEVLDRVLNKGAVATGEVTISVAGVDLLYLGLQLVLTSIETARLSFGEERADAAD